MQVPDILGLPWSEAEVLLKKAGLKYRAGWTKPTRNFFKPDEQSCYVVRIQKGADGILKITLANRLVIP